MRSHSSVGGALVGSIGAASPSVPVVGGDGSPASASAVVSVLDVGGAVVAVVVLDPVVGKESWASVVRSDDAAGAAVVCSLAQPARMSSETHR